MVHKLHGRLQSKTVLWSDNIMECMMKHIPHWFSLAMELGSILGDSQTCRVTSAGLQKIPYSSTKYHYMRTTLLWVIMQWAVVTSHQWKPEITVSLHDIKFDVWCAIRATRIRLIFLWNNEQTYTLQTFWHHFSTYLFMTAYMYFFQKHNASAHTANYSMWCLDYWCWQICASIFAICEPTQFLLVGYVKCNVTDLNTLHKVVWDEVNFGF